MMAGVWKQLLIYNHGRLHVHQADIACIRIVIDVQGLTPFACV
jgi:hypothetical protein